MERVFHPLRHRLALRALRRRLAVQSVGFVCLGHVCRSPYAAARLRACLEAKGGESDLDVRSAGFLPAGRASPAMAVRLAGARGVDLSSHRSDSILGSRVHEAALVLAMTSDQVRDLRGFYGRRDALHLGDLDPVPGPRRDIEDPVSGSAEVFERVYDRIDRAVGCLAEAVLEGMEKSAPTPDLR